MQPQPTTTTAARANLTPSKSGVVTLSGYGLSVSVERGHLAVSDGIAAERRHGRLHRATSKLSRLVILGHTGHVTLEALRWLRDVGAGVVQIDRDGAVILASAAMGRDVPQLRRSQAIAPWTGAGSAIARDLLVRKLTGQAATVRPIHEPTAQAIEALTQDLSPTDPPERLRAIEAQAAAPYWQALAPQPVTFARRDAAKVPDHWRVVAGRASPLTGSPRLAASPAHAILNYLYAMLEAEARIACLAVGLDPGLGVLHADLRARDSLACDLMEAVRPEVDHWLLGLLERRTFAARDFFEAGTGQCRVLPPLTHELAETLPLWARAVASVTERAAQTLMTAAVPFPANGVAAFANPHGSGSRSKAVPRLATPLTQANRSAGRPTNSGVSREAKTPRVKPARTCQQCGDALPVGRTALCSDACHAVYEREVRQPRFEAAGPAALARLRADGRDPSKTAGALAKVGATQRERAAARAAWAREHAGEVFDSDAFGREVLPRLQEVPLSAMMRATGLSLRYCSQVRRGLRVPHPMYWSLLAESARDRRAAAGSMGPQLARE